MEKKLFRTQDEIDVALAKLKQLKTTAGWQLLVQVVRENIIVLEDQILNGVEGATKDDMDRKRDKLKAYKEVIETPDSLIRRFEQPEQYQDDSDPFHTVDSLKETKKRKQGSRQDTK